METGVGVGAGAPRDTGRPGVGSAGPPPRPGGASGGISSAGDKVSVVEMGGQTAESQETRATEAAVRGFWKAYRRHMGY